MNMLFVPDSKPLMARASARPVQSLPSPSGSRWKHLHKDLQLRNWELSSPLTSTELDRKALSLQLYCEPLGRRKNILSLLLSSSDVCAMTLVLASREEKKISKYCAMCLS